MVLVLADADRHWATLTPELGAAANKPLWLTRGGTDRQSSCAAGLAALTSHCDENDWVLVHDAARACLHADDITRLIDELYQDPVGGLLATPARDTIKRADSAGLISTTIDRSELWHALTPQMFRHALLSRALAEAEANDLSVTDEANAVELLGLAPRLIQGRRDNIKITHNDDLALAEFILSQQTIKNN